MSMRSRFVGILGNLLEHYDASLFGLLAPFLAPLFFPDQTPLNSLVLTYGILCLGIIAKPLGSLYFGWMGDQMGRRKALYFSLMGVAVMTVAIGCLPTHQSAGNLAPILLTLCRLLQNFFAAGETAGGAIFVLEQTQVNKRSFMSSLYDASSIAGILIGSFLVTRMSFHGMIEEGWRYLFWAGGIVAAVGVLIRMRKVSDVPTQKRPVLKELYAQRKALLRVVCASGFSYAVYGLAFTLMNGFVPLVTTFSKAEVMELNTFLLACDMLLLPFFGWVAEKIGKEKLMLMGAGSALLGALPIFYCLSLSSFSMILMARFFLVVSGVAFAAPYHAWAIEKVAREQRYKVLSLGNSLGSQLIGFPTAFISLWLYQKTGWIIAPGLYLVFVSCLALYAIREGRLRFSPLLGIDSQGKT